MDIDLLAKMVKELILDNDRVVLPGLGAFVAEVVPSTFSDRGYTINPPYRKLYFRARPDEGQELADFYARSNNIAPEIADKIIKDFVSELKDVLFAKKTVVFPGLGRLRATKENNLFFIADEDLDIYPVGFGLEPISLKTHNETREEVSAAVVGLKAILQETEPERLGESEPDPGKEAVVEQEPEPASEPEPVPEPAPEPAPEPELKPESEPAQTEQAEPAQIVEQPAQVPEQPEPKKNGKAGKVCLTILAVIVLLLIAYMVAGRLCPEFIDRFLYSPEELQILNHNI